MSDITVEPILPSKRHHAVSSNALDESFF